MKVLFVILLLVLFYGCGGLAKTERKDPCFQGNILLNIMTVCMYGVIIDHYADADSDDVWKEIKPIGGKAGEE